MTDEKPGAMELERIGMGWLGKFPGGVFIKVTRLREGSAGFVGEIEVTKKEAGGSRVLEWGQFNLLAAATRVQLAKRIAEQSAGPWVAQLHEFCYEVVKAERTGPGIESTDKTVRGRTLRYLLKPFMPRGMATLVYGEGGTGKSTLAAAVAVSMQSGHSVFPDWTVEESCPVLILDWEASKEVWEDRLNAVAEGAGLPAESVRYRACRRRLVDDAEAIAEAMSDLPGIGLVIVDSVNMAFGFSGEHQDPAEAASRAFNVIRQVSGTDIAWLLIDHVSGETMHNRSNGHTPLKAYGSVAKQWLARQQFYLAGEREATQTRQELVLKHTKANYSWTMKPMPMVIHREDGTIRFEFSEAIEDSELSQQLTLPQRITAVLRAGPTTVPALRQALSMDSKKADKDKVWVNLSRMVKRGAVQKVTGEKYQLDPGNRQEELPPAADPDETPAEDQEEIG